MVEITEKALREMYVQGLQVEIDIAARFGVSQTQIGRLRKRWGIPTITKGERTQKRIGSVLTPEQDQLLVGSLLGDGWMTRTSPGSAFFSEGHCEEQAAYTEWKAALMEPFVSRRTWGTKRVGDRFFRSRSFATLSCPLFRFYYDLFYPAPKRKRVFPPALSERMTPLVLAVWYMDDGSVTNRGEPRIAFGLNDVSLKRALRAIRTLGLKPKVYGEGSNQSIQFPKQAMLFRSLIEPHVPSCMSYKLPSESKGQARHREARKLTPKRSKELYEGGMSKDEIAQIYGVGSSTVSRRLKAGGATIRRSGPRKNVYRGEAAVEILRSISPGGWEQLARKDQEEYVDQAYSILKDVPFPFPAKPSQESALSMFQKVRDAKMGLVGDMISPRRWIGVKLCTPFFPNRYRAQSGSVPSAWESWHEEKALKGAIRFQFRVGDPVVPHRVLRALTANMRTPTVFRPSVAKFLYETYCRSGYVVWDPCAGYGGRMVGALAAGVHYVGTEVSPETVQGCLDMAAFLGHSSDVDLHQCPAESFNPPEVMLVFTSPPYYHREHYAGGDQSWRYETFEDWVREFLRPVIQNGAEALLPGGHFILNVADVKLRGVRYPLVETTQKELQRVGLLEEATLKMPLSNLNRRVSGEPVLVWRKEGRISPLNRGIEPPHSHG